MTTAFRRIALLCGCSLLALASSQRSPDAVFGDGLIDRLRSLGAL